MAYQTLFGKFKKKFGKNDHHIRQKTGQNDDMTVPQIQSQGDADAGVNVNAIVQQSSQSQNRADRIVVHECDLQKAAGGAVGVTIPQISQAFNRTGETAVQMQAGKYSSR
ncbi:hypothetical protein APHAL10511_000349 [Amanita phalloides]|nr:hypothetical protein APHAL10511_000349 [Amanita phalloides]